MFLDHPSIVKLYDVVETKHALFLLMEYCEEGAASPIWRLLHKLLTKARLLKGLCGEAWKIGSKDI